MRRAAKIDGNHTAIVQALRDCGYSVQSLAAVGAGCPDLLVGGGGPGGWVCVMEIKDPAQAPSDQRLTHAQLKWHREWLGPAHVVYSAEMAVAVANHYRCGRKAA